MNTPEKLFHTLLGLGNEWKITELKSAAVDDIMI